MFDSNAGSTAFSSMSFANMLKKVDVWYPVLFV